MYVRVLHGPDFQGYQTGLGYEWTVVNPKGREGKSSLVLCGQTTANVNPAERALSEGAPWPHALPELSCGHEDAPDPTEGELWFYEP